MSRLKQYIIESTIAQSRYDDFVELKKVVTKDCKKYLGLLKGKKPFMRGVVTGSDHFIPVYEEGPFTLCKKKVRQNRRPRGTDIQTFNKLNKVLEKEGHVRRDRAVMATASRSNAGNFGRVSFIFPIGNFNYTYVERGDFNLTNRPEEYHEGMFITNKGFDIAYREEYEIWMDPKEYYFLDPDTYDKFWK